MNSLNTVQYTKTNLFAHLVRKELMKKSLEKVISKPTLVTGLALGLSSEEVNRIMEECYDDLVSLVHK